MDIKKLLEAEQGTTARGRAIINGNAIPIKDNKYDVRRSRINRAEEYLDISNMLYCMVENNNKGLTEEELEQVEFLREQLKALALKVYKNICEER